MRILFFLMMMVLVSVGGERINLVLPTENQHLFSGQLDRFYMYVDRTFEGEVTKPWEGGSFGFVRTPVRVSGEVVMTKFHEGIDIAPVKRDKAGNPLDLVMSISDGKVVHVSAVAGRSNYGCYVVVEHVWEETKLYSLYAHLGEITVGVGADVKAGSVLGRMGYTGAGINRTRAHLHLELGFLMSLNYEGWHKQNFGSGNYHGLYNGMNLAGVDVAAFFLEHKKNPDLKFSEFVMSREVQFKVAIPAEGEEPEFLSRHKWMKMAGVENPVSWEVGFAATGHVISFTPSERPITKSVVSHLRPAKINQSYLTRGLVKGNGPGAELSRQGEQLLSLVMDDFPIVEGKGG
jgi:hypothetical protein